MKMAKYLYSLIAILALIITAGGCSSGISSEDFEEQLALLNEQIDALSLKITDSELSVTTLSTISAYQLWFDQYYSLGTYSFSDVKDFNRSCGELISEVNDGDVITSWNIYIQADNAYYELLEELPTDTAAWTQTEYEQWVELNEARSDALGQVGATLFKVISNNG